MSLGARTLACLVATTAAFLPHAAERAAAQTTKPLPVVELFTSQGCSSCPAADALFSTLAPRRDIVALSMPVDYWDYLGWKDTLASPKFSVRQREYAAHRGDGEVYTPQIVVDGRSRVVGSDRRGVMAEIDAALTRATASPVSLGLSVSETTLEIRLAGNDVAADAAVRGGTVWVAVVRPAVEVRIGKGENRGKTVTYYNVVSDLHPVGLWSGETKKIVLDRTAIMASPGDICAVIVQHGKGGPIVAAGWFE